MATLSQEHKQLNEQGVGKCSVPMWTGYGAEAGFCDAEAYGERPPSKTLYDCIDRPYRLDGLYAGYVPGLACPCHGGPAVRAFATTSQASPTTIRH